MSRGRLHSYHLEGQLITSAECIDHPVCAVVIATFAAASWNDVSECCAR